MTQNEESATKKQKDHNEMEVVKVVMDLVKPFLGSKRVVNMDSFYTSPYMAIKMREQDLYMCGTLHTNRKFLPKSIIFTKSCMKHVKRGHMKMASSEKHGIAAFGWMDTKAFHFLTIADGTHASEVTRRIKGKKQ